MAMLKMGVLFLLLKQRQCYNFTKYRYIALHILPQFVNYLPLEFAFHLDYFISVIVKIDFFL